MSRYTTSKTIGRPRLPKEELHSVVMETRLTEIEFLQLKEDAKKHYFCLSDYIRWKLGLKTVA